jgi:hypothetical protein
LNSRQIQEKIDELKAMPVNYDELGSVWLKLTLERYKKELLIFYKDVLLSDVQLQKLAQIYTNNYKASLTQEKYNLQLNELHKSSVEIVLKELEKQKYNAQMFEMINGIDVWH